MLQSLLYYNVTCFGLSLLPLVLLGHRVRCHHWAVSLASLVLLAASGYLLLVAVGISPPLQALILAELLLGVGLIAWYEDWNALGHLTFWSLALAIGSFLGFTGDLIVFSHLGPWSLALSGLLLLLQMVSFGLMLANTYEILDVLCRIRWRHAVQPQPTQAYFPKVSLHVPAHNEPPEMVLATLLALARLDYPNYEVIMVDDNTADETLWRPVEAHCQRLGFKFFHLENWPGYKSGALNFALAHTDPAAEIIGVVDSDYLVEPHYLRDLVGLFQDPEVAFVQTPQDYRDFDGADMYAKACYDAYRYFFRISMATRNEHNGIIYAGTMGLVRRQVLEKVGGWDEWCITEDAELSLRILDAGYQGLYVDQTYGRGLMPLDYEGLKKQRFRWAFGGMQILRLHWRKLLPRWLGGEPESRLTWAQRFAYLSGGLQWLNDPVTCIFTVLLLLGVGALSLTDSLLIQPLAGTVMFFPLAFCLFGVLRFLWALRLRLRCSLREAYGALTILLGLTWVVTLACGQGLVRRQGVFLRTPKQRAEQGLIAGYAIVRWELGLSALCLGSILPLLVAGLPPPQRMLLIVLLGWQAFLYASAVQSWLWSARSGQGRDLPAGPLPFRTLGPRVGTFIGEARAAVHLAVGALLAVVLLWAVATRSSELERVYSILPERAYLPHLIQQPPAIVIKALILQEAQAALRGDVERALALWSREGTIRDLNFTPEDPRDDQVWQGREAIRRRYQAEFAQRTYLRLAHRAIAATVEGETARADNDLEALIQTPRGTEQVLRRRSDRWTFRQEAGEWKILSLAVNRSLR